MVAIRQLQPAAIVVMENKGWVFDMVKWQIANGWIEIVKMAQHKGDNNDNSQYSVPLEADKR